MKYKWGDLISLEYGKPVSDKAKADGKYPVYGTNGQIGTTDLPPLCNHSSFILGRKGAYRGVHYSDGPFSVIDTAFYAKNLREDLLDIHWAYYKFLTYDINSMDSGSAIPSTDRYEIYRIELDLPTLEEQRKAGRLLKCLDDKISLNKQINNNLEQQLIVLYQNFSSQGWAYSTIGEIADKVAMGPFGSNIKVSTFVDQGVPIISGNHLHGMFLEEPSFNYITDEHAGRLKNSIVYSKDIIFTHAGNIGQVAMIPNGCNYDHYVLSQRQFYLRCDHSKVLPEYILLFFHSAEGQHELLSYANQTGVPSIAQPATNLKKIRFPLPPKNKQEHWAEIVLPLIDLYQANQKEISVLASMRDGLLPKLMSGEIDVSAID